MNWSNKNMHYFIYTCLHCKKHYNKKVKILTLIKRSTAIQDIPKQLSANFAFGKFITTCENIIVK